MPNSTAPYKLLTTQAAAARLGIMSRRVRQLIEAGRIHGVRFGHAWLVPEPEVRRYLRSRRPYKTKPGPRPTRPAP
jgi:excisionase family DNA binding protein